MDMNIYSISVAIIASAISGLATAMFASFKDRKKEQNRQVEREQDHLKMEIKDLKIQLYQLEKDLTEWKDKYYSAIQQLIDVKSELENALSQLNIVEMQQLDSEF